MKQEDKPCLASLRLHATLRTMTYMACHSCGLFILDTHGYCILKCEQTKFRYTIV